MHPTACARIKLNPGSLARVREWAQDINSRRSEALETLAAEGVSIESVFLDSAADGDDLVYSMRGQSMEQAEAVARDSVAAIDEFHKKFKRETWAEVRKLELLVDLQRLDA